MLRTMIVAIFVAIVFALTPDWLFKIATVIVALLILFVLLAYLNGLKGVKFEKHRPCGCPDCVRARWNLLDSTDDFWAKD